MSQSALPPRGLPRHRVPRHVTPPVDVTVALPNFGTVPLGPDERELFTDAMARILEHLADDDVPGSRAS